MPNYPTHARWGRIGAVVMAVTVGGTLFVIFDALLLALGAALAAGGTTFVGAIFPDIDHHASVPRQKAVKSFQALVLLGVVALTVLSWDLLVDAVDTTLVGPGETALAEGAGTTASIPPELVTSALVLLAGVVLAGLVDPGIDRVTRRHRGWTHSVPVTFALTAAVAGAVWLLTSDLVLAGGLAFERQVVAVSAVGTFFVGVLIHLGLDGEIV